MQKLQLYIEGSQVELFEFESIILVESIQNIKDIQKVFIPYTKTFTIPASRVNNKILDHFYMPEIYSSDGGYSFDARQKIDAVLELNYQTFRTGKLKIESTILKNNKPYSYKVTFFSDTIELKDILGDDNLQALTLLDSKLTHDYTSANVVSYAEEGLDATVDSTTYTDALIYPLITHSTNLKYDSSAESLNNLYLNQTSSMGGVWWKELKPAISVPFILKAIEHKYTTANGYSSSLSFSSDFFSQSNDVINNLYVWGNSLKGDEVKETDNKVSNQLKFNTISPTDGYMMQNGQATIMDFGATLRLRPSNKKNAVGYRITVDVKVPVTDPPFDLVLYKDGQPFVRNTVFPKFISPLKGNKAGATLNVMTLVMGDDRLSPGDYTIYLESPNASSFTLTWLTMNIEARMKKDTKFLFVRTGQKIVNYDEVSSGLTFLKSGNLNVSSSLQVEPTKSVPLIKTIDFLTGLFKMFNLIAYKDGSNIVVKPLDSFYSDSTKNWDITEYVDSSLSEVSTVLPFSDIDFTYLGKETYLAKDHLTRFGKAWGDDFYKGLDNRFFDGKSYKVEVPFEHMKFHRLFDDEDTNITTSSTTSVAIGLGSKTLTVSNSLNLYSGTLVRISSTVNSGDNMFGRVTSYNSTTGSMEVNVSEENGSGTLASWDVVTQGDPTEYIVGYCGDGSFESDGQTSGPLVTNNPLVFYGVKTDIQGNLPIATAKDSNNAVTGKSIINTYYAPSNSEELNDTSQSINFGIQDNEYALTPSVNSLFKTYYKSYIEEVFTKEKRLFKYRAKLPLSFLSTFSLADDITIFDRLYRINSIKTNFLTGISELELLNVISDTGDRPVSDSSYGYYVKDVSKLGATVDSGNMTTDKTSTASDKGTTVVNTI